MDGFVKIRTPLNSQPISMRVFKYNSFSWCCFSCILKIQCLAAGTIKFSFSRQEKLKSNASLCFTQQPFNKFKFKGIRTYLFIYFQPR